MVQNQKDYVAQAVYLAQLYAAKGGCKCKSCELLRRATDQMTSDMLATPAADPRAPAPGISELLSQTSIACDNLEV